MKKLFSAFAFLLFVFAVACSGDSAKDEKKDSAPAACKAPLNPNGDSELALLMREIANWNDTLKAKLEKNGSLSAEELKAPADIRTILTAKRTDPNLDAKLFAQMASLYLGQVDQFTGSGNDAGQQVRNYNSMVKACVACHQNFCGGPLRRINKMFVKE